ncbi:glutamic-type intramembrane protease PrsW [Sinobaca sp. H24]|uniref:glutamic-type intramembrane protease PrsW n=1 Tax=Sinobaca sp. H24 TaxID=2923376 RepID=UPI002079D39A|nr:glutamic-type intramembrane protease PrsW [Sinobaca sp. H24]
MFAIITAALAPSVAFLSYYYLKQETHSRSFRKTARSFLIGMLLVFPIVTVQYALTEETGTEASVFVQSFLYAGLLEEFFKWFILCAAVIPFIRVRSVYDTTLYALAVGLGFAAAENILYLTAYGVDIALGRAFLPVASHALFACTMGYYIGKASFLKGTARKLFLSLALVVPFVLHGTYDLLLLIDRQYIVYFILPLGFLLWWTAAERLKAANRFEQMEGE